MNAEDCGEELRVQIDAAKRLLSSVSAEACVQLLYPDFIDAKLYDSGDEKIEALLRDLRSCRSKMADLAPRRSEACLSLASALGLSDIERILFFSAALSRMSHETVWIHYSLVDSLNRLLLAGVTVARVPCITHAFLTLTHEGGNGSHEGLARTVLARELRTISPREAIRTGIGGLLAGNASPMQDIIESARVLRIIEGKQPTRPDINQLKKVAVICGLKTMENIPDTVRSEHSKSVLRKVVVESEKRTLIVPRGDSNYYVFRDAGKEIVLPAISVYEIPNGTISFDVSKRGRTQFYVFDEDMQCISDLSWGINPFTNGAEHRVDGVLAVLGDQFSGSMNICHFLLDHLSRAALYERFTDRPITFLMNEDYDYYNQILKLTGLEKTSWRPTAKRFSVRAGALLVCSNVVDDLRHPAHLCASWALDFLRRRLVSKKAAQVSCKVYISREDVSERKVLNRTEVEQVLVERGFEPVVLSKLSASSQIELFQSASHVVGVHGAGLANVLFSNPGTSVVEIMPPLVGTRAYWTLCSQLKHRYTALVADDPEYPRPDYHSWVHRGADYNNRNVIVPIDRLTETLDEIDQQE